MREIIDIVEVCHPAAGLIMTKSRLSSVIVKNIDVGAAAEHFDLPYEDQFASKRQLNSGLLQTKRSFQHIFKGKKTIRAFRGLSVDETWMERLNPGDELGKCWAWDMEGAERFARDPGSVIIIADILADLVDWETTIAVNTFHPDERELVIDDYADIILVDILDGSASIANHLKGKIFSA